MTIDRLRRRVRSSLISLRRAFGQTRCGRALKQHRRAQLKIPQPLPPDPAFVPPVAGDPAVTDDVRDSSLLADALAWAERRGSPAGPRTTWRGARVTGPQSPITNVVFVSHCDFTGNSAVHVYKIASELQARGLSPAIALPDDAESVDEVGRPSFQILSYREAASGGLRFADGRGPDLVHAFTPRERVRELTAQIVRNHGCPYVVHLEDNDEALLSADLGGTAIDGLRDLPAPVLDDIIGSSQFHPLRGKRFVERAAGLTVVTERLLEFAPANAPVAIVRPGFDEAVLSPSRSRDDVRAELGLRPDDFAIVYTGTVHVANYDDMRGLYDALAALRSDGHPVVLVKTGWHSPDAADLPGLDGGIRDLGWVRRPVALELLAAADVLVQPGGPGPFNDYRFPAKLPDFLASGRPVILPRSNIGLSLRDGRDAIVLQNGSASEIYQAIERVRADRELAAQIGAHGRAFALGELRWSKTTERVEELYRQIASDRRPAAPWRALELDPPVKLICLVADPPDRAAAQAMRAHGIYGFCFPIGRGLPDEFDFPFCVRVGHGGKDADESLLRALAQPGCVTVAGAPLLVVDDDDAPQGLRSRAEAAFGGPVHLALMQGAADALSGSRGFDSLIEAPRALASPEVAHTMMREQLGVPLPQHFFFRSIAFPERLESATAYRVWLRKLVLQTLARASAQEPLVFLEPRGAWADPRARGAWLRATRSALRDGVHQFYASRRLRVERRRVEAALRLD